MATKMRTANTIVFQSLSFENLDFGAARGAASIGAPREFGSNMTPCGGVEYDDVC